MRTVLQDHLNLSEGTSSLTSRKGPLCRCVASCSHFSRLRYSRLDARAARSIAKGKGVLSRTVGRTCIIEQCTSQSFHAFSNTYSSCEYQKVTQLQSEAKQLRSRKSVEHVKKAQRNHCQMQRRISTFKSWQMSSIREI